MGTLILYRVLFRVLKHGYSIDTYICPMSSRQNRICNEHRCHTFGFIEITCIFPTTADFRILDSIIGDAGLCDSQCLLLCPRGTCRLLITPGDRSPPEPQGSRLPRHQGLQGLPSPATQPDSHSLSSLLSDRECTAAVNRQGLLWPLSYKLLFSTSVIRYMHLNLQPPIRDTPPRISHET